MKRVFSRLLFWLSLLAATTAAAAPPPSYMKAVRDAAVARPHEIVKTLDPLREDNDTLEWNHDRSLVKVVTWKSQSSFEEYILPYTQTSANEEYVLWVTLSSKLRDYCRNYMRTHPTATKGMLERRLKQRLGLNPDSRYDVFVEMWVSPSDVFRPCVDPDPRDTSCNLNFGAIIPVVKNIRDYKDFYQNIYYKSFRAAPGVPWTGLGYTYDWSGLPIAVEKGMSEFILSPSSPYVIDRAVPTMEYCLP